MVEADQTPPVQSGKKQQRTSLKKDRQDLGKNTHRKGTTFGRHLEQEVRSTPGA